MFLAIIPMFLDFTFKFQEVDFFVTTNGNGVATFATWLFQLISIYQILFLAFLREKVCTRKSNTCCLCIFQQGSKLCFSSSDLRRAWTIRWRQSTPDLWVDDVTQTLEITNVADAWFKICIFGSWFSNYDKSCQFRLSASRGNHPEAGCCWDANDDQNKT